MPSLPGSGELLDATRSPARLSERLVTVLLVLVVIASGESAWSGMVSAAGLGDSIAAARARQSRAEQAMREADRRVRSMTKHRQSGPAAVRSAARRVARLKTDRRQLDRRVDALRERRQDARRDLDRLSRVRPSPAGRQVGDRGAMRRRVESLGRDLRSLERRSERLERRFRQARREKRDRARSVSGAGGRLGAVVRRREAAESRLGHEIHLMTRFAKQRSAARSDPSPARSGLRRPAAGRITQRYGCTRYRLEPRRGSCRHFHDGLDIAAPAGSPVRAAAAGVVAYVGWNPWDQGRRAFIIVLGHAGGFETLYGHLKPVRLVRAGQPVRRGQLIGRMGSTGNSTGPHLHWEASRGFRTRDPLRVGRG
jgi:murein DD-endopeptidase MepM/ murein hydrolase activator NlpD